ncbi:MAG: DUF4403 family protein [Cyclobacteriaceae bacterium]|nr:DUF4403 family protein [Cyclobacteriaceae bacterium]MDX5466422.1 DUF4403 family protein [Cyclobacteriaceae bacterium]
MDVEPMMQFDKPQFSFLFLIGFALLLGSCKTLDPFASPEVMIAPQAYSKVNVPLEVPFGTMSNLINQRIPPVLYDGKEIDLDNGVLGNLKLSRAGLIQVEGVDEERLVLTFPLRVAGEVWLKPTGLRRLFQNKIPLDQTLQPKVIVNPTIYPNWALGVSEFDLLDLGGKMAVNVMGFEVDISQLIRREVRNFASQSLVGRKDLLALKPMIDQAWSEAGKPIFVDFQGKSMAFSIQPDSVKMSEKINPGKGYQINLGLAGKVNSHPGNAAPSRAFPLPSLSENFDESNELEIRVPLFLSYEELNEILKENFENHFIRINRTTVFNPSNFQTQAFGEKLGIWMDFLAIQENGEEITGRIFLVGLPDFDFEGKALGFKEIDFYLESNSRKAKTAARLKKKKITRQLNQKLNFPMEDTFASGISGIQERLSLSTPIANLKVVNLELGPEGFYPGKLGLTIHLIAKGAVEVNWK